jgi:hypothetical protein
MMSLTDVERIGPQHHIAASAQHAGRLAAAGFDGVVRHRGQLCPPLLPCARISVFEILEHAFELRIEEHQRRAAVRYRPQQLQRVALLRHIAANVTHRQSLRGEARRIE